jgi:hypothetical protein
MGGQCHRQWERNQDLRSLIPFVRSTPILLPSFWRLNPSPRLILACLKFVLVPARPLQTGPRPDPDRTQTGPRPDPGPGSGPGSGIGVPGPRSGSQIRIPDPDPGSGMPDLDLGPSWTPPGPSRTHLGRQMCSFALPTDPKVAQSGLPGSQTLSGSSQRLTGATQGDPRWPYQPESGYGVRSPRWSRSGPDRLQVVQMAIWTVWDPPGGCQDGP